MALEFKGVSLTHNDSVLWSDVVVLADMTITNYLYVKTVFA